MRPIYITYRRKGGLLALLAFVAAAAVAAVFTLAAVLVLLVVGLLAGAAVLAARFFRPGLRRRRASRPVASWPHDTIEGTVVARERQGSISDSTSGSRKSVPGAR